MASTKIVSYLDADDSSKGKKLFKSLKVNKLQTLRKLFIICQPELPKLCIGFSALLVNAVTNLSFPWILGEAVDQTHLVDNDHRYYYLFGVAGVFFVASCASFVRIYCLNTSTQSISTRLKSLLFHSFIDKDMDFFDEIKKGQLLTLLNTDVTIASELYTEKLSSGLRSVNSSLLGSILLYNISPYLFSISITVLPVIGLTAMQLTKYSKSIQDKIRTLEASLLSFTMERLQSITSIRLFNREANEKQQYSHQLHQYTQLESQDTLAKGSLYSFINFSTNVSLCIVLYLGGRMIRSSELTAGDLTKFALQSAFVGLGFSGLSVFYGDMQKGVEAAGRILSVLEEQSGESHTEQMATLSTEDIQRIIGDATVKQKNIRGKEVAIELRNIYFKYKLRDAPVLEDLSLKIYSNSITAIVGRSGAGKSTVMALLSGLYTPQKGRLLYGGIDVTDKNLQPLRQFVGVVEQSAGLLSGTITNSISYGKDGASMEEVIEAAQQADAHSFINLLPDGYNTQIGEAGSLLSGGQRARLALSRALIRNPKYLLLDEVMSSLDKTSEAEIVHTLKKSVISCVNRCLSLSASRTIVVFSHSESVMKQSDLLYVLKDHTIAVSGNYSDIKDCPEFMELFG